ncbi:gag polyprotein [Beauveria bassiana ARSEF 2860]|uniref:Gag polyprotein n=1 Tax=Beauveria bassiana (strain ARSEF 2860) TaxID=655819 RepID=J4KKM3_BEAB2|nr:gag polyprotein [Beauveria bassiana ARSEF 2860]EJP60704.1 gag polyprotein [Beauveria bassiana ARSEF 2860]
MSTASGNTTNPSKLEEMKLKKPERKEATAMPKFPKPDMFDGAKGDDDESQIELFYDGLREDVKDKIYKEDRPDTLDTFIEIAIKIDNRNYARRMEKGGRGGNNFRPVNRRYQANIGKRRNGSTAYRTHLGPIELNATGKEKEKKYYNCGKARHFANKCRAPKKQWKLVAKGKGVYAAYREELPV